MRVTENEVRQIITTSETDITAFMMAANTLVDAHLTGSGMSDAHLKEIERWLAAHFISIKDIGQGGVVEDQVGASRERYADAGFGEGLKMTRYGQQALVLDTSGVLANLAKRRASFRIVEGVE